MPRLRPKFKDRDVVVAWQGYAWAEHTFPPGTRLRADHPAVKANPHNWVLDGTPADELPSVFDDVAPPTEDELVVARRAARIPDEEAAVCVQAFSVDLGRKGSRLVREGDRLRRDDPLVRAHPDFFRTPMMPLEE